MRKTLCAILLALGAALPAHADEVAVSLPALPPSLPAAESAVVSELVPPLALSPSPSLMSRALGSVEDALSLALDFIGIRYRYGGSSPETGFDCSGFVRYVYNEALGLVLPHSAKAIAQQSERVERQDLKPGDLVFFNTRRRAFSHVGIYLGDNLFIHAPRTGSRVRVEDMTDRYWSRRFNGARRLPQ